MLWHCCLKQSRVNVTPVLSTYSGLHTFNQGDTPGATYQVGAKGPRASPCSCHVAHRNALEACNEDRGHRELRPGQHGESKVQVSLSSWRS